MRDGKKEHEDGKKAMKHHGGHGKHGGGHMGKKEMGFSAHVGKKRGDGLAGPAEHLKK